MTDPLYEEWLHGGLVVYVRTWRDPGETQGDWERRHDEAVAAMRQLFPED